MAQPKFVPSSNEDVWDAISGRLSKFTPSIKLTDYVDFDTQKPIDVLDYASEGINFVVSRTGRKELLQALNQAKTDTGKQAFKGGRWKGTLHTAKGVARDFASAVTGNSDPDSWALNASFWATDGTGFRQIWYPELKSRQLRLQNARPAFLDSPSFNVRFDGKFQAPNRSMDFSSLHFAVAEPDPKTGRSACNVHVDQVGVLANLAGTPALVPDLGYHAFVELAFRTGLKGLLPGWALQNIDFIMPSSRENYAMNFGVQINYNHSKDLKLSVRGMCAVRDEGNEWSTTFNLSGRHNIWGSKR